jgi:hypothetical protein
MSKGKRPVADNRVDTTAIILDETTQLLGPALARLEDGPRVFCIDCTHHRTIPPYHYCKASPPDLVTGAKEELPCRWMREMPVCGPEGKLFEPAGPAIPVIKYEG